MSPQAGRLCHALVAAKGPGATTPRRHVDPSCPTLTALTLELVDRGLACGVAPLCWRSLALRLARTRADRWHDPPGGGGVDPVQDRAWASLLGHRRGDRTAYFCSLAPTGFQIANIDAASVENVPARRAWHIARCIPSTDGVKLLACMRIDRGAAGIAGRCSFRTASQLRVGLGRVLLAERFRWGLIW